MIIQANVCGPAYRYAAVDTDCMIVDPPYAPKVHAKATSAGTGGAGVRKRDLGFGHLTPELMLRIASYAAQVRRWSVVFCDRESTHLWRAAMALHGVEYVRTIPWVRWSQPQMSGDRPPTGAEDIVVFHRAEPKARGGFKPVRKQWNGPGNRIAYYSPNEAYAENFGVDLTVARDVYTAKSLRGDDKYSCEKPLDLMLALVSDYSDPGETVFDPCAGAGTTLLAAEMLGRRAYGFERNAKAAAWANHRVGECVAITRGQGGVLSERDEERACRWAIETRAEASAVPEPKAKNGSDVKTWERAQRRLADVERLVSAYGG